VSIEESVSSEFSTKETLKVLRLVEDGSTYFDIMDEVGPDVHKLSGYLFRTGNTVQDSLELTEKGEQKLESLLEPREIDEGLEPAIKRSDKSEEFYNRALTPRERKTGLEPAITPTDKPEGFYDRVHTSAEEDPEEEVEIKEARTKRPNYIIKKTAAEIIEEEESIGYLELAAAVSRERTCDLQIIGASLQDLKHDKTAISYNKQEDTFQV
jgi:hypothetical protein